MIIEFFGCEWNKCLTKLNTVLLKKKPVLIIMQLLRLRVALFYLVFI